MTIYFDILTSHKTLSQVYYYGMGFGFISLTFMGHKMQAMNKWYLEEYSRLKILVFNILKERTYFLKNLVS